MTNPYSSHSRREFLSLSLTGSALLSVLGLSFNPVKASLGTITFRNHTDAEKSSDHKETESATPTETDSPEDSPIETARSIFQEFQTRLRKMIDKCGELGMSLESSVTERYFYRETEYEYFIPPLPKNALPEELPNDATAEQKSWFNALKRITGDCSAQLYQLAKKAADQNQGFDVAQILLLVLRVNPDHTEARRVFGYRLKSGKWRTLWEINQLEKGNVEHPEFGWLPQSYVEKYEAGKRYYRGRWVDTAVEKEKMQETGSGWKIETEHYSIVSHNSLEEGVLKGRLLESYYRIWEQFFLSFAASDRQWIALFRGEKNATLRRHKVFFYKNREAYLEELKNFDHNVGYSTGGYFPEMESIFLYTPSENDDWNPDEMLFHEATHQLFQEGTLARSIKIPYSRLASKANFWALEGICTYMETIKMLNNGFLIGGTDSQRFQTARLRVVKSATLPLAELAGMNMRTFQTYKEIAALYTQANGWTTFFMHHENGKYKQAFIDYLHLIYAGKDRPQSLEDVTGKTFLELDDEYRSYMLKAPDLIDRKG